MLDKAQNAAAFGALAALLAVGVGLQIAGQQRSANADRDIIGFGATHYPRYRNLQELDKQSSVVVEGSVVRTYPSQRELPRAGRKVPQPKLGLLGVIETDALVRVTKVISGRSPGKLIRVRQLGGRIGRQRLFVEGEPLARSGERYVLFLRRSPATRTYTIVGGSQGRYLIRNGKLNTVSGEALALPVPHVLRGYQAAALSRNYGTLLRSTAFARAVPPPSKRQQPLKHKARTNKPAATTSQPPVPPGR